MASERVTFAGKEGSGASLLGPDPAPRANTTTSLHVKQACLLEWILYSTHTMCWELCPSCDGPLQMIRLGQT